MDVPRSNGTVRRRSVLSVPASDPHKCAKAIASAADEVVLDLEDAVAVAEKDSARARLVETLASAPQPARSRLTVRVNAPRTPWCHLDLMALAVLPSPPASVVVPKVEGGGDLAFVDRLLDGVEAGSGSPPLRVQALIESAAGLAAVDEIARASARLDGLVLGYADLAASLGLTAAPEARQELWLPAQCAVLVAARAAGIAAVDGPHLAVTVDTAFSREVARARDLGFDGKWAIHPRQVDHLNHAFTPSPEQVGHARAVLDALDEGRRAGAGAVQLDGQMLDEALGVAARRVLARAT